MLGENKEQIPLTRAALSTPRRAKCNFLSAHFNVGALFLSSPVPTYATAL